MAVRLLGYVALFYAGLPKRWAGERSQPLEKTPQPPHTLPQVANILTLDAKKTFPDSEESIFAAGMLGYEPGVSCFTVQLPLSSLRTAHSELPTPHFGLQNEHSDALSPLFRVQTDPLRSQREPAAAETGPSWVLSDSIRTLQGAVGGQPASGGISPGSSGTVRGVFPRLRGCGGGHLPAPECSTPRRESKRRGSKSRTARTSARSNSSGSRGRAASRASRTACDPLRWRGCGGGGVPRRAAADGAAGRWRTIAGTGGRATSTSPRSRSTAW
jgi:hypothetical protein